MTKRTARDNLLEAAYDRMLSRGYRATTVDQICENAGVSKGSFYHFFKSKEDLGVAVLAYGYATGSAELMQGEWVNAKDPMEYALGFLERVETVGADHWRGGCLMGSLATEVADTSPRVAAKVSELFTDFEDAMVDVFAPFAVNGPDGPSARQIAGHFLAVLEGAIVMSRAYDKPERIPEAVRQFRHYLLQAAV
jgi:TetR/AcrR family transcriptional repressor of nem operon